jgi:hypothetical protein
MKILFSSITYGKDIFAGMENSAFNFIQGLKENGHDISVFTGNAYATSGFSDGINIYASKWLPNKFPLNDAEIIDIYETNRQNISEDLANMLYAEKPDLIISWEPLWGVLQYLDKTLTASTKTAVVFHVVSSASVLKKAVEFGYDYYFSVSNSLKDEIKTIINFDTDMALINHVAWNGSDAGLPLGNAMSIFFVNYYMEEIDRLFEIGFARYSDDMFFNMDIYDKNKIIPMMEAELDKLHLSINKDKIKVIENGGSDYYRRA